MILVCFATICVIKQDSKNTRLTLCVLICSDQLCQSLHRHADTARQTIEEAEELYVGVCTV